MPSIERFCLVPGRFLFLVSIFLFLLVLAVPRAAWADQAVVKEAVVNLRSAPTTESAILGKAAQGERLEVIAKQGDWYRVTKNGVQSWVAGWLVSLESSPAQTQSPGLGQAVVKEAVVNLRSAPTTESAILGKAARGEGLKVLAKQGDWYRVTKNGVQSWVAGWLVSLESSPAQTQSSGLGQAVVKEAVVNLRSAPTKESAILGKAARGEGLKVLAMQGDWYRVTKNGAESWVAGWLVDVSPVPAESSYGDGGPGNQAAPPPVPAPEKSAARAEVTENGVNIRSGPGTGFSILGQAVPGSQYEVDDKSGGWYKISGGSISGWISEQFVKISAAAASRGTVDRPDAVSGVAVVKGSEVNIRSGPGTNYNVVSRANRGQSFSLVDVANDWYKVKLENDRTGWVVAWLVDIGRPQSPGNEGGAITPGQNSGAAAPAESKSQNGTGIIPPPPKKEPENSGVTAQPPAAQKKENGIIKSVAARTVGNSMEVTVKSDGKPMKYSITTALNPDRIVVDINDFEPGSAPENINITSRLAKGVRVGLHSSNPAVTRVVVDLAAPVACEKSLSSDGTQLTVKIKPRVEKSISGAKIVLDPGHGGSDPGAIGPTGLKEKTVNLDIARKAAEILRKQGATVVLTRTGDVYVDLNNRPEVANKMGADLFVSIHSNSNISNKADGTSTYHRRSDSGEADLIRLEGAYLSRAIQKNLLGNLKRDDLGVLQADFVVIAKSRVPAALAEVAFVSNPQEEKLLADDSFRMKAAAAIAQGITDFLKMK